MWRGVPRPCSAGAGHGERFHTSADRVTCDNPLWDDKVKRSLKERCADLAEGLPGEQVSGLSIRRLKGEKGHVTGLHCVPVVID